MKTSSTLQRKTPLKAKTGFKRKTTVKKRRKRSDLAKLKDKLWQLCREIQIKRYGNQCYTCPNKPTGSGCHLGHFISSSVCSTEIRYDLENLRPQCYRCNIHLSGNWVTFERHLKREGIDVEDLKQRNELTKGKMYREDWYQTKIAEYEEILGALQAVKGDFG